jgi:hypothetical protein
VTLSKLPLVVALSLLAGAACSPGNDATENRAAAITLGQAIALVDNA